MAGLFTCRPSSEGPCCGIDDALTQTWVSNYVLDRFAKDLLLAVIKMMKIDLHVTHLWQ